MPTAPTGVTGPYAQDILTNIINVQWGGVGFVAYGANYSAGRDGAPAILMHSKDGLEWTVVHIPDQPQIIGMVFGKGVWILASADLRKSTDLFKTWTTLAAPPDVVPSTTGQGMCYGIPQSALKQSLAKKNGVFASFGQDSVGVEDEYGVTPVIWSSDDLGSTWNITLRVPNLSSEELTWSAQFVTFLNGIFIACAFRNGGSSINVPGECKIFISKNGLEWDGGTNILQDVLDVNFDMGAEGITRYPTAYVLGMIYKKKSKKYIISGQLFWGVTAPAIMFYAESDTPNSFSFSEVSQLGTFVPIGNPDPTIPQPWYFHASESYYAGGYPACVDDNVIITLQKGGLDVESVSYVIIGPPPTRVPTTDTIYYLSTTSDHEGVLTLVPEESTDGSTDNPSTDNPSTTGEESFFCEGLVTVTTVEGEADDGLTNPDGSPTIPPGPSIPAVHAEGNIPESLIVERSATAIANSHKDTKSSLGTFLFTREMTKSNQDPPEMVNRGQEIWRSQNGSDFTKITHPFSGQQVSFKFALGATPNSEPITS